MVMDGQTHLIIFNFGRDNGIVDVEDPIPIVFLILILIEKKMDLM